MDATIPLGCRMSDDTSFLPRHRHRVSLYGLGGHSLRYLSVFDARNAPGWESEGIFLLGRAFKADHGLYATSLLSAQRRSAALGHLKAVTFALAGAVDLSHNLGATLVRRGGSDNCTSTSTSTSTSKACPPKSILYAVGGQFLPDAWARRTRTSRVVRLDGLYVLSAASLTEILDGSWFPFGAGGSTGGNTSHRRQKETARRFWGYRDAEIFGSSSTMPLQTVGARGGPRRVLDGMHSGCRECREGSMGACEFDGKISVVYFRQRFLVFARANLEVVSGGRFVQVARSLSDDAQGAYGAFRLLTIAGYHSTSGNIYFAAVQTNPLDAARTLLGLFPVTLNATAATCKACGKPPLAFIGLSISCDGFHWAPLVVLQASAASKNRTWNQPVTGMVLEGDTIHAYIHENVPGVSSLRSWLRPHALRRSALERMTQAAHHHLPGCASQLQATE